MNKEKTVNILLDLNTQKFFVFSPPLKLRVDEDDSLQSCNLWSIKAIVFFFLNKPALYTGGIRQQFFQMCWMKMELKIPIQCSLAINTTCALLSYCHFWYSNCTFTSTRRPWLPTFCPLCVLVSGNRVRGACTFLNDLSSGASEIVEIVD